MKLRCNPVRLKNTHPFLAPQYDSTGSYQASGASLGSSATQTWIDTSSYSTQHYAFLTGQDASGAIGIAYLGTACLRVSSGKFI